MDFNLLNFTNSRSNNSNNNNTAESGPSPNGNEDQTLKECESYVGKHNVKDLLKDCIVQLCLKKPDNPVSFLKQHFEKLERVSKYYTILVFYLMQSQKCKFSQFSLFLRPFSFLLVK